MGRHQLAGQPQQVFAEKGTERDRSLPIGPQQLLVRRDIARLDRGRALRLDQDVNLGAVLGFQQPADLATGIVAADDRYEGSRGSQGHEIAQHIAGAAQGFQFALNAQHRDRRLGRDPLDLAVHVVIEHHVADAQDAGRLQAFDVRK